MRFRIVTLATASAALLSMSLMVAPMSAGTTGPPIEIEVSPTSYNIPACYYHVGTPSQVQTY